MLRNLLLRRDAARKSAYRLLSAGLISVLATATLPATASAQFFFFDDLMKPKYRPVARSAPSYRPPLSPEQRQQRRARKIDQSAPVADARDAKRDGDAGAISKVPLYAVVSLDDQHVSVYGADGLIERADVSTGTPDHPTPTGIFAIIQKERWHESNIYSGASMPFMQRITWSGVAMHTGQLPGYPASHGCIRLRNEFAERWFGMTKLGLRVVIGPSEIEPQLITHRNLPIPRYWPVPVAEAERKLVQSAGLSNVALVDFAAPGAQAGPRAGMANPIAYAISEKAKAKSAIKPAEQAESTAGDRVDAATKAAKDAAATLKLAERDFASAQDRFSRPVALRAKFGGAGDGVLGIISDYDAAYLRLDQARRADVAAKATLSGASEALRQADAYTETLKARVVEMGRRQENVSVFISLKDGRLYVRQALRPVFDIPIAIRDPDQPIGTHVFVATPPAEGSPALRWMALSLPVEAIRDPRLLKQRRSNLAATGSIAEAIPAESASGALDRIQIPGEVIDLISERVWSGASVIISDRGITHETGTGTDFIIETKHDRD